MALFSCINIFQALIRVHSSGSKHCYSRLFSHPKLKIIPKTSSMFLLRNLLTEDMKSLSLNDIRVQRYIKTLEKSYKEANMLIKSGNSHNEHTKIVSSLKPLFLLTEELENYKQEEQELQILMKDLEKTEDKDLLAAAQQEEKICRENLKATEEAILHYLLPKEAMDEKDIVLELTAGVGGQEAMLFTRDIFDMYVNYALFKGWQSEIMKYDTTEIGGLRTAHLSLSGTNVYQTMKYESGIHRVQRIPKTEKSGRIHTSTMAVAVLPQPKEIDISLNPKDIKTEHKSSSGAGGQNVNKTLTCVRLTHLPTGIVVECQMERMQYRNHEIAMKSLRAKLYQIELQKSLQETTFSRKLQVGTAARSDKIRTYNFPQDRITDHRNQKSFHGVLSVLEGTEKFDRLLDSLKNWSSNHLLFDILKNYEN